MRPSVNFAGKKLKAQNQREVPVLLPVVAFDLDSWLPAKMGRKEYGRARDMR